MMDEILEFYPSPPVVLNSPLPSLRTHVEVSATPAIVQATPTRKVTMRYNVFNTRSCIINRGEL